MTITTTKVLDSISQAPEVYPEQKCLPKRSLVITNEAGLFRKNPPWELVEQVIRGLHPYQGNKFCCLSEVRGGNYIQALCCGHDEFRLEQRYYITGHYYVHSYACPQGASLQRIRQDERNGGVQRDLPPLSDVISSFCAYYRSQSMPANLKWRRLDI